MLNDIMLCEELFHTTSGVAFADFITVGHRETWPIRSKRYRTWLWRCSYQATGDAPSAAALRSALDLLEARAQFDAPERGVNIRVAEHAGRLYLDLADEHWHAVEIGPDGWRVLERAPVRFRRSSGMLPLPVPECGGSIDALRSFLNLLNQNDFVLVVAWAAGGVAVRRSLPPSGGLRRAGLGKDSPIKAPQSAGRSQCGPGQSAPARGTRADDRSKQRPSACL
jgi:hypothetical protein